ncbi:MAG: nucleotide sugar dehydrogenase, partial [Planctomycetes bacterium]|nr:nucleotide sugar dehydrogenase [Planctomycetota bacterium]
AGLAYKPNVDDERESPSYVIMKKLESLGATVLYNDPFVPVIRPTREHPEFAGRQSSPLTTPVDAIVIVTAHDEYRAFDWAALPFPVIDSRNAVAARPKKYYRA